MDTKTEKKTETEDQKKAEVKAETKPETKAETKPETKAETKADDKKKEDKFDFKAEAKKWWNAIVRFLKPFKNLDKKVLLDSTGSTLKKNVNMIYLIGSILLIVLAVYTLFATPGLAAKFFSWVVLLLVFLLFRLTCETLAKNN